MLKKRKFLFLILIFSIAFFLLIIGFLRKDTDSNPSLEKITEYLESKNTCIKDANYNQCQNQAAMDIVRRFNFADVLVGYESLQKENPNNSCHDIMHFIASNEYKKNKNLPEIFNKCTSVCFNACYHGGVLGYIESNLAGAEDNQIEQVIIHACDSLKDSGKQPQKINCVHGIGHSLMLITDNELHQSLSLCNSLSSPFDRETCYGGVFMENFPNTSSSDHPSKYIRIEDPLYPCNSLDKKYLSVCYTFLSDYFSYINNHDLNKTISMCGLVPMPYRENCYRTIGSSAQGRVNGPTELSKLCKNIPPTYQKFCIQGVVISFADRFGGDKEKMLKMFDFCTIVDADQKKVCYNQIGINLSYWLPQERFNICSTINEPEKSWCLE